MRCFVASAFGRSDVDAVYDNCVVPALRQLSARPVRVDRVEHNDDIDNKIFELLDAADIVLVDLSYARPSVYYEAGYATGQGKPVVYIARSDHFKARDSDPDGLLRVHFDLQMKNVVSWTKPDEAFRERLAKRLRHVVAPLQRAKATTDHAVKARLDFGRLSQSAQVERITSKGTALLRSRGFSMQKPGKGSAFRKGSSVEASALAARTASSGRQDVVLMCRAAALKRLFEAIQFRSFFPADFVRGVSTTQTHYVIASLASVPKSRIVASLTGFESIDDTTYYQKTEIRDSHTVDAYVHVLAPVKSEDDFADMLRCKLKTYGMDRGA